MLTQDFTVVVFFFSVQAVSAFLHEALEVVMVIRPGRRFPHLPAAVRIDLADEITPPLPVSC